MQNGLKTKAVAKSSAADRPDLRAEIELRAYHLWLADGGRHGNDLNHWLRAEREIAKYAATKQTKQ